MMVVEPTLPNWTFSSPNFKLTAHNIKIMRILPTMTRKKEFYIKIVNAVPITQTIIAFISVHWQAIITLMKVVS